MVPISIISHHYLVVELTQTALQVEGTRVGEFGKHFEMGNQLSARPKR